MARSSARGGMGSAGLLPAAARVAQPWANGGGLTREIAVRRDAAGVRWRVSLADVARSGPFSKFVGLERTIVLISRGQLALDFGSHVVELSRWVPFEFLGDVPVIGLIGSEPTLDLNVMTRREAVRANVMVHAAEAGREVRAGFELPGGVERVLLVLEGRVLIRSAEYTGDMEALDALACAGEFDAELSTGSRLALIEFWPLEPRQAGDHQSG